MEPFSGKVDELTKALEAFTFQLTRSDDPNNHSGGQRNACAFAIQADYTSPGPPIGPSGQTQYRQTYPRNDYGNSYNQEGYQPRAQPCGPLCCIYCDDPNHLKQFCPHVCADYEQGVIHTNENGRLALGPRGSNGPELSTY